MQEYNSIKWTFLKWRLLREAQAVLKHMECWRSLSHFTGKSLQGWTHKHRTDTGTTAHIYKWKYLSLTRLWRLVLFLWVGDHLLSSFLEKGEKKEFRIKFLPWSQEDLGQLLSWAFRSPSSLATHRRPCKSILAHGSFFLAFVLLFQREVSIPLLNAATTEGLIPKIQPPEHWHGYWCSLSNCVTLEKVEGRKTPISCQGRHSGPRSDLTANKSCSIIFNQTEQVPNTSVTFGRCHLWQNPREKQRQY